MKYYKFFIMIGLFTAFTACHSSKEYFETQDYLDSLAKESFGNYLISYNKNSTLALISSSNQEKDNPNFKLKFKVVDISNKKVILEREMDNTKVSWYDNNELLTITQLGFVDKKTGVSQKRSIINVFSQEN